MASRHAVLLTPSLSSRPIQPLSCTQITRETPLIPFFVFKTLRTLSFSVSCKSCVCHSYANGRGGYQQFPTWNESLAACNQLSTFNRVSFPSSHLSLSQRSAKSFTIRTSETPLPQLLYNPHLQALLGSAGNKGLITPLESALTKNSPVSRLESALTKTGGGGSFRPFNVATFQRLDVQTPKRPHIFQSSPLFSHCSELFCTHQKLNSFVFMEFQTLCTKHLGCGGPATAACSNFRALPRAAGHGLRDTTHDSFLLADSPSGNSVGSAGGASAMASSSG